VQFYNSVRLIDEPVAFAVDQSVQIPDAAALIDIVISMNTAALAAPALLKGSSRQAGS
jgi:hypothetical protein